MNKNQKLEDYIREHPTEKNEDIANRFKITPERVAKCRSMVNVKNGGDNLEEKITQLLVKNKGKKLWTVEELSSKFDVGIQKIVDSVQTLREKGLLNLEIRREGVRISKELPIRQRTTIDIASMAEKTFTFGVTADNHLGSKYERMDVLNALFDIWARDGVTTVYQCGNMIEGERHSKTDIHKFGMQNQVDYFVKEWPSRPGITTEFITGDDHEGWYIQDEGINIGKFIELTARDAGRTDLKFLGHMEHDIKLQASSGSSVMRLIHAGGGSAYATSYSAQKIVESYQGGEKPHILLIGHYHKILYFQPREVQTILAGCTKDQDSFLRKNKIPVNVGGWTVSLTLNARGVVTSFTPKVYNFYNLGHYSKAWGYKW